MAVAGPETTSGGIATYACAGGDTLVAGANQVRSNSDRLLPADKPGCAAYGGRRLDGRPTDPLLGHRSEHKNLRISRKRASSHGYIKPIHFRNEERGACTG